MENRCYEMKLNVFKSVDAFEKKFRSRVTDIYLTPRDEEILKNMTITTGGDRVVESIKDKGVRETFPTYLGYKTHWDGHITQIFNEKDSAILDAHYELVDVDND